jgi:hypothetical protein
MVGVNLWWGVHMLIKQSAQQAWQRFLWHPITGPAVPMAALIGLVTWCWYAVGLPIGLGARANMTDFDCRDFATQAQAQAFFEANGPNDPYWLDFDRDGRACELFLRR